MSMPPSLSSDGIVGRAHLLTVRLLLRAFRAGGMRGSGRGVEALARIFGAGHLAVVPVFGDRAVEVDLADGYWVPAAWRGQYEPEVEEVLRRVLGPTAALIDCGANIGWWSIFATTRIPRAEAIVAVEAASPVFARLEANRRLNGERFRAVHAAVWRASGEDLPIRTDAVRHAWSSVDAATREHLADKGFLVESVRSVSVDEVADGLPSDVGLIVLKLDVEGAEREALRGAANTLRRNLLLVYEDHGRAATSDTSAAVMALGLDVFTWDPTTASPRRLHDLDGVQRVKTDAGRGYNFFACRPGTPVHDLMVHRSAHR